MIIRYFTVFMILFLFTVSAWCADKTVLLSPGDKFPNLTFPDVLEPPDKEYLGLQTPFFSFLRKETFQLDEIKADILFIEFFNKYCTSCQVQAPVNNKLYKYVLNDPLLRDRIKFIGIGAGNSLREVTGFRMEKNIPFPLLPDKDFNGYEAIGDPGGTPYMLIVRKTGSDLFVVSVHMGLHKDMTFWIDKLRTALNTDIRNLKKVKTTVDLQDDQRKLDLKLTRNEIIGHVEQSMRNAFSGISKTDDLNIRAVDGFNGLFTAEGALKNRTAVVYSKLISRKPVCDVCHGIYFIVTFDSTGIIKDIHAVHLTKYGNVIWDSADINKINTSLVGKRISPALDFNSEVDAVSTATMTTSLIYNSVKRLSSLLKKININD